MFDTIITLLITISVVFSIALGNEQELANAALSGCSDAVELCIGLAGAMGLWGGLMNAAQKCGISKKLCALMKRPLKLLFSKIKDEETLEAISLNVTANLLGLGNAATPLGIKAMKALTKTRPPDDLYTALFILLNTASIQLVPVSTAAMRIKHGSADVWGFAPAALLTSVCALMFGIVFSKIIYSFGRERKKE